MTAQTAAGELRPGGCRGQEVVSRKAPRRRRQRGGGRGHVAEHRSDLAGDRGHPGLRAALHAVR